MLILEEVIVEFKHLYNFKAFINCVVGRCVLSGTFARTHARAITHALSTWMNFVQNGLTLLFVIGTLYIGKCGECPLQGLFRCLHLIS